MNARSGRIGIFGGSFDPVHYGHLISAQDALEQLGLDTLLFLPTAVSPLRDSPLCAPPKDRLSMIHLALADDPRFEVSDLEVRRGGVSYTIESVRQIREQCPDCSPTWIIGADQVDKLSRWRDIDELTGLTDFACFKRPGHSAPEPPPIPGLTLQSVHSHQVEISATEIRERIREKRPVRFFLPDSVIDYISKNNLYS